MDHDTLTALLKYHDFADEAILTAAEKLSDAQLDQPFEIGPGSLRRTLIHTLVGEWVWVQRWQGRTETRWPDESAATTVAELKTQRKSVSNERDKFLHSREPAQWSADVVYRDSRGKLFRAALREMVIQFVVHSVHHRAQAVNILRRLGGAPPELDFMGSVRRPADDGAAAPR